MPTIDSDAPQREKLRKDKELASEVLSSKERDEPMRSNPQTATADARRPKVRTDNDEPI
jgi:hypothetical protein